MENDIILLNYFNEFGQDLNIATYPDSALKKMYVEMKKAIDGKRGPLTDKEFGQFVPEGVYA